MFQFSVPAVESVQSPGFSLGTSGALASPTTRRAVAANTLIRISYVSKALRKSGGRACAASGRGSALSVRALHRSAEPSQCKERKATSLSQEAETLSASQPSPPVTLATLDSRQFFPSLRSQLLSLVLNPLFTHTRPSRTTKERHSAWSFHPSFELILTRYPLNGLRGEPRRSFSVPALSSPAAEHASTPEQLSLSSVHAFGPNLSSDEPKSSDSQTRRDFEEGILPESLQSDPLVNTHSWTTASSLFTVLTGSLSGNFTRLIGSTDAITSVYPANIGGWAGMSTSTITPPAEAVTCTPLPAPTVLTAADIGDASKLRQWLEVRLPEGKSLLSRWGTERGTKRVSNLWQEMVEGEVCLVDSNPPWRKVSVVSVHVRHAVTGKVLVESMQEMGDGSMRARNRPLSEKMKPGEDPLAAGRRGILEELGAELGAHDRVTVLPETLRQQLEERDSFSYPGLRTRYEVHSVAAVVRRLPEVSFCTVENECEKVVVAKVHNCAAVTGEGPCIWATEVAGVAGVGKASSAAVGRCGMPMEQAVLGVKPAASSLEQIQLAESCGAGQVNAVAGVKAAEKGQKPVGVKRHFWVWMDKI